MKIYVPCMVDGNSDGRKENALFNQKIIKDKRRTIFDEMNIQSLSARFQNVVVLISWRVQCCHPAADSNLLYTL